MNSTSEPTQGRTPLWGIRDVAEHTGHSINAVRKWVVRQTIPAPVSQPRRRLQWEADQIQTWWAERQELLDLKGIVTATGMHAATVVRRRRDGRWPAPDAVRGQKQLWRPETITRWLEAEQRHKVEQRRQRELQRIELRKARQPQIVRWSAVRAAQELGMGDSDLAALQQAMGVDSDWPEPAVRNWWQHRFHQLRDDPGVLLSSQVAAHTGLSWESVRTYRRKGILPEPDGQHRNHPWWHVDTIEQWNQQRRHGTGGRPRTSGKTQQI